ncbi:hypothetical protein [Algoriphagus yeomjeoni]|uniref:Uncharacterized protein n=1 Tax=Algoriphagus yeomjeoni TaxID=291403 RepID=A0A327PTD1_9BACT|nr:hypothetical protein [Algoriphagus yeomjeoni]RAI95339.1 hypothetical protein LV83_00590 [Algoriphagus yeomjeoni]
MWQLIVFIQIWFLLQLPTPDYVVLIINDCKLAKYVSRGESPERFFITLDYKDERKLILVGHDYLDQTDMPSTMSMSFAEIQQRDPLYTSDLKTFEAWANQVAYRKDEKKIFILLSKDYCSGNRFITNQQFTLYEVNVLLQHDE